MRHAHYRNLLQPRGRLVTYLIRCVLGNNSASCQKFRYAGSAAKMPCCPTLDPSQSHRMRMRYRRALPQWHCCMLRPRIPLRHQNCTSACRNGDRPNRSLVQIARCKTADLCNLLLTSAVQSSDLQPSKTSEL